MKLFLALAMAAAVLYGAEEQKAKKDQKSTAARQAKTRPVQEVKIPEGAVEVEPDTYKYTDAQGVKWTYRKTPFGVAKYQERADEANTKTSERAKDAENITAVADGDVIHFERPGPFGVSKWQKKVSELDELEKAAWERAKAKSGKQE